MKLHENYAFLQEAPDTLLGVIITEVEMTGTAREFG